MDRVKASGKLKLGYSADARPFSYKDGIRYPAGFAIDLVHGNRRRAKAAPGHAGARRLNTSRWHTTKGSQAVAQGKIDISCEAHCTDVSISQAGLVLDPDFRQRDRRDRAQGRLVATSRMFWAGRKPPASPTWRANADRLLRESTFSVVAGTRDEKTFNQRMKELKLIPRMFPVNDYASGIQRVLDGRSNAFFGNRAILLDGAKQKGTTDLVVLDRLFTHEAVALAVPRGDEDFRLLVDQALSSLFRSGKFGDVFGKWFGPINERTLSLFQINALPE